MILMRSTLSVNGPVLEGHRFTIVIVPLVVLILSTLVGALPLSTLLLQNSGRISYPQTQVFYVTTNATGTYELNSTFQVIAQNTNSLTVLNRAISDASQLHSSLFVYNGTYQISGTINMKSNVNMTLQDGVFINETGSNQRIILFNGVTDSGIYADSNVTIHGTGGRGYDMEEAFRLVNCDNITIAADHPFGLTAYNIGNCWIEGLNVNNSVFQNLYGYQWEQSYNYQWAGALFDGLQNCQIINMVSDGLNGDSRSALVIGGETYATNNVTIIGGVFSNAYYDNGIYLGGWSRPVTNINIINVTTAYNNMARTGHSGIKIRPACNVTVVGWVSDHDFNGMEMDSVYDTEGSTYLTGGSWYNNISGTINSPLNAGLILDLDGSSKNQSLMYNIFDLNINNATQAGVWFDNGFPGTYDVINYNTLYLNVTGSLKQAVAFSAAGGTIAYNTIFGRFVENGKSGYTDISFDNLPGQNYNVINVYSTSGNPRGLYSGNLGTNVVNYPYV